MAVEGLLGGDERAGARGLVLDGLGAEAADPAAVVALAHAGDVGERAVLGEAARRALHALHLGARLRGGGGFGGVAVVVGGGGASGWWGLGLGGCDGHWLNQTALRDSEKLSSLLCVCCVKKKKKRESERERERERESGNDEKEQMRLLRFI